MAGTQITNITTKQDLMVGLNCLNVIYTGSFNFYTVSGMIECAGAWYRFVNEVVEVTTSDYIKIVPSTGTATLAAITSFSGVSFDTDKNGYYVTGTNERVFAYRDTTTSCFLIQNVDQMIYGKTILNNNLQVNGTEIISGNSLISGSIYPEKGKLVTATLLSAGATRYGYTIYNTLASYVVDGTTINCSGVLRETVQLDTLTLSHVTRSGSTLVFYGYNSSAENSSSETVSASDNRQFVYAISF